MIIWSRRQIAGIAADALEAGAAIDGTLGRRKIMIGNHAVWGQYLDEERYSDKHWGLLGTTAAVRTLSMRARPVFDLRHLREALPLLPESRTQVDPLLRPKVAKGDLENMIRLAFIAEALAPDRELIPRDSRPDLVAEIYGLAEEGRFWAPRSAYGPVSEGDPFTTAYVLYCLGRYEDPEGELRKHRLWLAEQMQTRSAVRQRPDLVALIGLALIPRREDPEEPRQIQDALDRCQQELRNWSREESIALDRPLFQGFNMGDSTDYTFLHPEIMASLFFLRTNNPWRTRRYVARVTQELILNVDRRGYFEGQPGMAATVDQMWASKLLFEFNRTYNDEARRHILFPVLVASSRSRWLVVLAMGIIGIVAVVLTEDPKYGALAAAIAWLAGTLASIAAEWAREAKS